MQWGHIKTVFILSFLILNIFLFGAFNDRQQEVGYIANQEVTIEEQLAAEDITYGDFNVDITEATYISVMQRTLSDEELEQLDAMDNQDIVVFENNHIISELDNPFEIQPNMSPEAIEALLQGNVLYSEEFQFWDWNEELNILVFFQTKEGRSIYYNESGLLLVYLDEDNQATHYTQTILGESEVQGDLVTLNQPTQVIGILFNGNHLQRGDEITDVNMGYYSRISAEGIQVFAPTWKIEVNDERHHFVNAIEGIIYDSDSFEFYMDTISDNAALVAGLEEDEALRSSILAELNKRLELDNRSETE
ncbi:two-component system regulatory protein YycI [Oceanobacillus sp. CAU 1775]